MVVLILLIVVLACVLAYVPNIPQIGRVFLMIGLGVLCALVLLDVLGLAGLNFGGYRLHC